MISSVTNYDLSLYVKLSLGILYDCITCFLNNSMLMEKIKKGVYKTLTA